MLHYSLALSHISVFNNRVQGCFPPSWMINIALTFLPLPSPAVQLAELRLPPNFAFVSEERMIAAPQSPEPLANNSAKKKKNIAPIKQLAACHLLCCTRALLRNTITSRVKLNQNPRWCVALGFQQVFDYGMDQAILKWSSSYTKDTPESLIKYHPACIIYWCMHVCSSDLFHSLGWSHFWLFTNTLKRNLIKGTKHLTQEIFD